MKIPNRECILLLTLAIVLTIGAPACGNGDKEGTEPVKLGTLLDYTGDLGVFGPPMRNGADLAAELINDAGGVLGTTLKLRHKDSSTSDSLAIDAARTLINTDGVGGIVGSGSSGVTLAVANSVTIPNQVVLMSPSSTSPTLTVLEDNDFVFRTTVSDAVQGVILGRLAKELGYSKASALYVNNAYGEGLSKKFKESFEAEGGDVASLIPQESGQTTYISELRAATESDPAVLVAIGYPESGAVYLREALEHRIIDTFLFVDGNKSQGLFDELGVDNFKGFYGTAPGTPESDASRKFQDLYEDRYGQLPSDAFIGETFDAVVLFALAIEKAGSADGPAIRDSLRFVANAPGEKVGPADLARALELLRDNKDIDYEGVAGSQEFDANGDVLNTIEIWKIENGQIKSTGRFELP